MAVALVFLLSKILTSRIMKPIDALDFANPLDNEIYEEMDPLLIRIDEQQRQLKQQNSELAEAENMRRDFSSNVSHEMKTPLQVISGYAELMKNDMVQPSDRQKFAALIYDEAQTMRSLINDVLTLSKLDESAFENDGATAINLYAVAQRVAGRLSSFADDQGVRVRVEGASACIAGSETLAEEMLYNLIENGIRYNHEGGLVTMKVGSECVEGGLANAAYQTVVRVSDTGPGIPATTRCSNASSAWTRAARRKPEERDWVWPSSSMRLCTTEALSRWRAPKGRAPRSCCVFPALDLSSTIEHARLFAPSPEGAAVLLELAIGRARY